MRYKYTFAKPIDSESSGYIDTEDIEKISLQNHYKINIFRNNSSVEEISLYITSCSYDKSNKDYFNMNYNIRSNKNHYPVILDSIAFPLDDLCEMLECAIRNNSILTLNKEMIIDIINKHFNHGEIIYSIYDMQTASKINISTTYECIGILYNSNTGKVIANFNTIEFLNQGYSISDIKPIINSCNLVYNNIIFYIPDKNYYYSDDCDNLILNKNDSEENHTNNTQLMFLKHYIKDNEIADLIQSIKEFPNNSVEIMNQFNLSHNKEDFEFNLDF